MVVMFPFVYFTDKYRRNALSFVNDVWATVSTSLFCPIEVVGRENLPSVETPAVYVANHASYLDIPAIANSTRRHVSFVARAALARRRDIDTREVRTLSQMDKTPKSS